MMVTDRQVRKLMKLNQEEEKLSHAAAKAGMSDNTARKYLHLDKLPSQCKSERTWRTRKDPFDDIWDQARSMLELNPGLESKALFQWFQRQYPGVYQDGQLRTFQRRVKQWRAVEGPAKEVYFSQVHYPGVLCASDFTHLNDLGVTIAGEFFPHLLYHFVLTYSNWETGTICFSESFESLSTGLQNALWELGAVPKQHRTDRLSAAVQKVEPGSEAAFTRRYQALLSHYSLKGQKIRAGKSNENGDVEQRHYRFKQALNQSLLLRGSRDFSSRQEYETFIREVFSQLNSGRSQRFLEELNVLSTLPLKRLDDYSVFTVRVGRSSTIRVAKNVYSVDSRLINENIVVRLYADYLEVWYGQKKLETIPRLRGSSKHRIQYRHIIEWLRRKPGAFENYRYRSDLFPTSRFRMAYDQLKAEHPTRAHKEYLNILYLAARETESGVDDALGSIFEQGQSVSFEAVKTLMTEEQCLTRSAEGVVEKLDLHLYDRLLEGGNSHADQGNPAVLAAQGLPSEELHIEEGK